MRIMRRAGLLRDLHLILPLGRMSVIAPELTQHTVPVSSTATEAGQHLASETVRDLAGAREIHPADDVAARTIGMQL